MDNYFESNDLIELRWSSVSLHLISLPLLNIDLVSWLLLQRGCACVRHVNTARWPVVSAPVFQTLWLSAFSSFISLLISLYRLMAMFLALFSPCGVLSRHACILKVTWMTDWPSSAVSTRSPAPRASSATPRFSLSDSSGTLHGDKTVPLLTSAQGCDCTN